MCAPRDAFGGVDMHPESPKQLDDLGPPGGRLRDRRRVAESPRRREIVDIGDDAMPSGAEYGHHRTHNFRPGPWRQAHTEREHSGLVHRPPHHEMEVLPVRGMETDVIKRVLYIP